MLKEELLNHVTADFEKIAARYDLGKTKLEKLLDDVIEEGIVGFKYTLIVPDQYNLYNHKILTVNGIHLDLTNLEDYFKDTLNKKFERWYPEYVDRQLSEFGSCYIDRKVYENAIDKIELFWDIRHVKYSPALEAGTKDGYVISTKKEGV